MGNRKKWSGVLGRRFRVQSTVVGVLIEVPVMLSVVKIVTGTRAWYECGAAVQRRVASEKAESQ